MNNPELSAFLTHPLYAYMAFVFLSWTSPALFDMILRFDRFGRLALPPKKIATSNLIALCLIVTLGLIIGSLLSDFSTRSVLQQAALKTTALIIPVSRIYAGRSQTSRNYVFLSCITLILLGVFDTAQYLQHSNEGV